MEVAVFKNDKVNNAKQLHLPWGNVFHYSHYDKCPTEILQWSIDSWGNTHRTSPIIDTNNEQLFWRCSNEVEQIELIIVNKFAYVIETFFLYPTSVVISIRPRVSFILLVNFFTFEELQSLQCQQYNVVQSKNVHQEILSVLRCGFNPLS